MDTLLSQYRKVRSVNSTDMTFPATASSLTAPSADGVIAIRSFGEFTRGSFLLVPYGTGADNSTLNLRVIGWRPSAGGVWVPAILCQASCTLSASVGVAGGDVLATERFADTLSLTLGTAGVDAQVVSPANDLPGHLLLDAKGSSLIEVQFARVTATASNALVTSL